VTHRELSQRTGTGAKRADTLRSVPYQIVYRVDEAGTCPVLVREGEELPTGPGVQWRR